MLTKETETHLRSKLLSKRRFEEYRNYKSSKKNGSKISSSIRTPIPTILLEINYDIDKIATIINRIVAIIKDVRSFDINELDALLEYIELKQAVISEKLLLAMALSINNDCSLYDLKNLKKIIENSGDKYIISLMGKVSSIPNGNISRNYIAHTGCIETYSILEKHAIYIAESDRHKFNVDNIHYLTDIYADFTREICERTEIAADWMLAINKIYFSLIKHFSPE